MPARLTAVEGGRTIEAMGAAIRAWRERVAEALSEGASLDEVEHELIEPAPLPADLRDALWLYAWGLTETDASDAAPTLQRLPR